MCCPPTCYALTFPMAIADKVVALVDALETEKPFIMPTLSTAIRVSTKEDR